MKTDDANEPNHRIFVAIAGNIGSGKTTLTQLLAERFKWKPHFEAVTNNPYLEDFYGDMARWSFNVQIFFLNHRYHAHRNIISGKESSTQDRSIYEDAHIFAKNLHKEGKLNNRDYENYLSIYRTLIENLTPPDLVIYLRKNVPKLQERIKLRGRDYEDSIPKDYLQNLNDHYDDWIGNYREGKVLTVESDDLDFLNTPEHFEMLSSKILSSLDQKDLFSFKDVQDNDPLKKKSSKTHRPLNIRWAPQLSNGTTY